MERRLAVHAGDDAEALTPRRPTMRTALALVALAATASPVMAKPKKRDAKAAFDRGVAAYKKNDYPGASSALMKSYELEADVDTLFAWAQAERKQEHCDKASELYEKLLTYKLPPENKSAVEAKLQECREIFAAAQAKPAAQPVAPLPPEPTRAEVAPTPVAPVAEVVDERGGRAWYKDPVAIALLGTGVVATGLGTGLLLSAKSLHDDSEAATDYAKHKSLADDAQSRSTLGLITVAAGGALVIGGVVWVVTHRGRAEQPPVSAWLTSRGGGLAFTGGF